MSQPSAASEREAAGYRIDGCDTETCDHYLAWLLGDSSGRPPRGDDTVGLVWALAHCDDGVTWGRYDSSAGRWKLGSEVTQDISPRIRREALQELRIFGEDREVLIWRTDMALRGRILWDTGTEGDRSENPLYPSHESRILRGNSVYGDSKADTGFTHLIDHTGAQQVVPVALTNEDFGSGRERRCPLRLYLRHYYGKHPETGAVRIVATRLVRLDVSNEQGGR